MRNDYSLSKTEADLIVLAGDISIGIRGIEFALHLSKSHNKPVIYIAGNHEFYHHDYSALLSEMRAMAKYQDNVHFLECDELIIEGVRFLGTTFWTDYLGNGSTNKKSNMSILNQALADHKLITKDSRPFTPDDACLIHMRSKVWLTTKLAESFNGKTIVITHHAPSLCCQHPFFDDQVIATGFLSNCDALVDKADVWIYGHSHSNIDTKIGSCRLVSNQAGYPYERLPMPFRPEWLLDI